MQHRTTLDHEEAKAGHVAASVHVERLRLWLDSGAGSSSQQARLTRVAARTGLLHREVALTGIGEPHVHHAVYLLAVVRRLLLVLVDVRLVVGKRADVALLDHLRQQLTVYDHLWRRVHDVALVDALRLIGVPAR